MNELIASYSQKSVAIPATLRDQIERFCALPKDLQAGWQAVFVPNAEAVADALEAEHFAHAPIDVIAAWLLDLEHAVAATLSADQISGRISVIVSVLGDQPAYCWTRETFAKAAKTFRFFPTVAELADFQKPIIEHRQIAVSVIRRAAKAKPSQHETAPPAPSYVVTSTPDWVGKAGPHFSSRPEPGEIKTLPPARNPIQQAVSLGITDPILLGKIRAQAEAANIESRDAPKPILNDSRHHTIAEAVAIVRQKAAE